MLLKHFNLQFTLLLQLKKCCSFMQGMQINDWIINVINSMIGLRIIIFLIHLYILIQQNQDPMSSTLNQNFWEPTYLQMAGASMIAGSVATTLTHPFDFIKTIIQYKSQLKSQNQNISQLKSGFYLGREFLQKNQNIMSIYRGFEASMMGRLGYLLIRNTIYKLIYDIRKFTVHGNEVDMTTRQKAIASGFSGGIAAFVTSPFTLISIRQILDSQLQPQQKRNYLNSASALEILQQKGIVFKGSSVHVLRHFALNVTLSASYDSFYNNLSSWFGLNSFISSSSLILSAFVCALVTLPFDNIRTQVMQSHQLPQPKKFHYKATFDSILKSMSGEKSFRTLWSGFNPYYLSILSYAVLTTGVTNYFIRPQSIKQRNQWQI